MTITKNKNRCSWVGDKELMIEYHDEEWGVPVHDDIKHFEMLTLEGAQAGLSWDTVLKKRENYKKAFDGFNPEIIALYDDKKIASLLQNAGIIRNRLKVNSTVLNAKIFLQIQQEYGSFDEYVWEFVDNKTIINHWHNMDEMPATSAESDALSKDLKKRGLKFIGSTIIYAYMQAIGMVDDHLDDCFVRNCSS